MAWIESEQRFMGREERQERIDAYRRILNDTPDDVTALPDDLQVEIAALLDELERLERVHRAEVDSAYFEYEYLSDIRNPDNEDNLIAADGDRLPEDIDKIAAVHRAFHDKIDYVINEKPNARLAIKAARGLSKSGKFSNGFPLHQVCYRRRKYILMISQSPDLAQKLVQFSNKQLKYNEKLRKDFGPLLSEKTQENERDNLDGFMTKSGTLVEATSSGKRLRGKRRGSRRPDLVILDDPSDEDNEATKELRDKLIMWFDGALMPVGSRATCFIVIGTPVTATGLINHIFNNRQDFEKVEYPTVLKPPDNPDLWKHYLEVYATAGPDAALSYYDENKAEMDAGIEMAWPWRWSYRELMNERANMKLRKFNSEFMLKTYAEDEQYFRPDEWSYYDSSIVDYSRLVVSSSWDIAMGKNSRSDYNAIVTVGKDESTGYIYILDVYATKRMPHEVLDVVIEKIRKYKPDIFSVETIGAFHEYYRQLAERCRKEGIYKTRLNPVKSHKGSKEARIESLEPMFANKVIQVDSRFRDLIEQAEQYPHVENDDILDALQVSVEHIVKRRARVTTKPRWA